jgi:hypothetical protein
VVGWWIGVFRQAGGGDVPAGADTELGARLAVWQTGASGLDWLDELANAGRAIDLGGDGYPTRYTAQYEQVRPQIIQGPPDANEIWSREAGDIVTEGWLGKTTIYRDNLDQCAPNDWLVVEAWDES